MMQIKLNDLGQVSAEPVNSWICFANALYDAGREGFLNGTNDWDSDHRVILHDDADDTPNLTTDNFLDDVLAGARVAVSAALASPTSTAGVADANDITLNTVTGDPVETLIIYQHTGTESTSDLVCTITSATGLPVTPNGGNITIAWDSGANKIFKL
jgi:hypothetical protein